jgi:hypothetical protein
MYFLRLNPFIHFSAPTLLAMHTFGHLPTELCSQRQSHGSLNSTMNRHRLVTACHYVWQLELNSLKSPSCPSSPKLVSSGISHIRVASVASVGEWCPYLWDKNCGVRQFLTYTGEDTPRKLTTATQPQFALLHSVTCVQLRLITILGNCGCQFLWCACALTSRVLQ